MGLKKSYFPQYSVMKNLFFSLSFVEDKGNIFELNKSRISWNHVIIQSLHHHEQPWKFGHFHSIIITMVITILSSSHHFGD